MKRLILLLTLFIFASLALKVVNTPGFPRIKETETVTTEQDVNTTLTSTEYPNLYANKFNLKDFEDCTIYFRNSINIPESSVTLTDRSEVRCNINGVSEAIIVVTDKENYSDAKNNIYNIWDSEEGIKLMIVDQNGGGSGEGIGKIVWVTGMGSEVESCFYYTYEAFHGGYNAPYAEMAPPTAKGMDTIKKTAKPVTSSECTNFAIKTYYLR